MSGSYVPTATYHATITTPDDGDMRNAASVDVPLEQLADNAEWLKAQHAGTLVLAFRPGFSALRFTTAAYAISGSGNDLYQAYYPDPGAAKIRTAVGDVQFLEEIVGSDSAWGFTTRIPVIDGATLSQVRARFRAATPHAGLPGLMPRFGVWRAKIDDGAQSQIGAITIDPSATIVAYDAAHWVTVAPVANNVIDVTTYDYAVTAFYEGHGNSLPNGAWAAFELTYTNVPRR